MPDSIVTDQDQATAYALVWDHAGPRESVDAIALALATARAEARARALKPFLKLAVEMDYVEVALGGRDYVVGLLRDAIEEAAGG